MDPDSLRTLLLSLILLACSAFFVAAEYGLVGARRARVETLARKGNRNAQLLMRAFGDISTYVACIQNGITLCGIALGSVTEPTITGHIEGTLGFLPPSVVRFISIIIVTLPLVALGELAPKYVTLKHPERVALAAIQPLRWMTLVLYPLVWLTRKAGELAVRPFGIQPGTDSGMETSREELAIMIQASQEEGHFEESQATMISKALKLDKLDASDVMIHRLDIKWVEKDTDREGLDKALKTIPHSRIPVCSGDIDDLVGVVYWQDILRSWDKPGFQLETVIRPAVSVPENLTLDRVIQRMREAKTQILIVRDEYGGTAGLLTLEDVVEEVFGELEDSLESERPPIERASPLRVTARADVRYDELIEFLEIEPQEEGYTTETLAEILINSLGRVPKMGDAIEIPIGTLRVENMARRRITRIVVLLKPKASEPLQDRSG